MFSQKELKNTKIQSWKKYVKENLQIYLWQVSLKLDMDKFLSPSGLVILKNNDEGSTRQNYYLTMMNFTINHIHNCTRQRWNRTSMKSVFNFGESVVPNRKSTKRKTPDPDGIPTEVIQSTSSRISTNIDLQQRENNGTFPPK